MFLGIDLGTSGVKLLLLNEQHQVVAHADEALAVQRPQELWSEQDPGEWWAATERAALRLRRDAPRAMAAVCAVGLSGQMHGAVLLDEARAVLRPAILWNDGRSSPQCVALEAAVPDLHAITGNLAMPGFTAPKLLWVREHEPDVFARTSLVLLPKDWLRLQLTGEVVGEMSDASGTLWLDVAKRCWSQQMLEACGLDERQMPCLVEGSEVSGRLRADVAARWGLPAGIPVAAGAGDNAASAVGIGAVRPNEGFVSLGTSGVVFRSTARCQPNPQAAVHAFCHALPGTWHQMSVMLSAASALRWARELLGLGSEAELLQRVEGLGETQRRTAPIFLPYLTGERTPHNDPHAQGALFGLKSGHDAASVGWSVIEGVAFGLRDGWSSLGVLPGEVAELTLVGGGARSAVWAQLLADVLQVALTTRQGSETAGALGAARLAWLSAGASITEACPKPAALQRFEPQRGVRAASDERYARFRALYPALQGLRV
jgi:xylulokinase